jgi:hypothetical protein
LKDIHPATKGGIVRSNSCGLALKIAFVTLALDKVVDCLRSLGCQGMWMGDGCNGWLNREGARVRREEDGVDEEVVRVVYGWGGNVYRLVTLGLETFKSVLMVVNPLTDGVGEVL